MYAKRIGLFFGSFNPIHIGHLIIANILATQTPLDEVWLVVSPHNPHKPKKSLAKDYDRLHLVQLAVEGSPYLKASDIEFGLPKPSYTIDTLTYIKEKYPTYLFHLIMGGDNLATLHKWKNHELILRDFPLYIYKRPGYKLGNLETHPSIHIVKDVPQIHLSASFIRKCIHEGKSVRYMLPEPVYTYLEKAPIYR
ncbi:MAG: nicotinate-nucleotide adenylyltransferase [Saprospiraceae bacterium]|nr:nicotinate-nucleotide adenylyltransferase [Saprospiraceae bacterium]